MRHFSLVLFLGLAALTASAQEAVKSGWSYTPLPELSYNSDIGLNLGAYCNFFYYGPPGQSSYPRYQHMANVSASYATKGSWSVHAMFDSFTLIPGLQTSVAISYRNVPANNFYGFNGIAQPYEADWDMNRTRKLAFYTNQRRFFRVAGTFQGIIGKNLRWLGGAVYRNTHMDDFSLNGYESGNSLFLEYRKVGLINEDEFYGGKSLELKMGFSYDTRDVQRFPSKGIWAELYLNGNADLSREIYNYVQVVAHFRHYLSILPKRMIFAYHLALQHTLWGEMPYYLLTEIATPSYPVEESVGMGSRYTVRGYLYNRILAAGYAWSNIELRLIPFSFDLLDRHIDLILNPFVDLVTITNPYRLDIQEKLQIQDAPPVYQDRNLPLMVSLGIGGKIHINTNMILSLDLAKGMDPQLSSFMLGMSSSYVF